MAERKAGEPANSSNTDETKLEPEKQLSRSEKIRGFVIGFVGWYLINGLIWLALAGGSFNGGINSDILCFTFPANLLLLIVLALTRQTRTIALGILAALALNFVVSLVLGATTNAICFVPFYYK